MKKEACISRSASGNYNPQCIKCTKISTFTSNNMVQRTMSAVRVW